MYNRYIPQPDGTFRRSRMQDPCHPPEPPKPAPCCPEPKPAPVQPKPVPPCPPMRPTRPCRSGPPPKEPESGAIASFLHQILPKGLDAADLIVVLLLLLMSADSCEDNSALLTLALYLFL